MINWPKLIAIAALIIVVLISAVYIEDRFFGRPDFNEELFTQQREKILSDVDQKLQADQKKIQELENKIQKLNDVVELSIEIIRKSAKERDIYHEDIESADTIRDIDELLRNYPGAGD